MKTAIVIGVGPDRGLAAQLCKRFAAEGLKVIVAGRTLSALQASQPERAWSFEIDVRTPKEKWSRVVAVLPLTSRSLKPRADGSRRRGAA